MKNYLITLLGPTAIGKTRLAIALAQHFKCEIISCDSRQFYKEMTIGTAVPTEEEQRQAPHYFLQHRSIFKPYSVGDFERETIDLLNVIYSKKNIAIMVGGSGLYADAVLFGLDDFPQVPEQIRQRLKNLYQNQGILPLQKMLKDLDSEQYEKMDTQNPQRLIRVLEVCLASGKKYSSFLNKKQIQRNFTPIQIALTAEREQVYHRINQRVELMLEAGLLREVQELFPYRTLNALNTVGYKEFFDFLEGKSSLQTAIENVKTHTRRFAKRQYTWLNKYPNLQWFGYQAPHQNIIEYINAKILENNLKEK